MRDDASESHSELVEKWQTLYHKPSVTLRAVTDGMVELKDAIFPKDGIFF